MKIFEGLRGDRLIDINTLAQHKQMREKKKEMIEANLKMLADIAEKQKIVEEDGKNKLKVKHEDSRRQSKRDIFKETVQSDFSSPENRNRYSASQIMHMRAQSFVQSKKNSKMELFERKKKGKTKEECLFLSL